MKKTQPHSSNNNAPSTAAENHVRSLDGQGTCVHRSYGSFGRRKMFLLGLFWTTFFITLLSSPLFAQGPVLLDDTRDKYPLGPHLEILEDKEKKWTIEDVTSAELSNRFVRNKKAIPRFGLSTSAFWVRVGLKNNAAKGKEWLLEVGMPLLDQIELYIPETSGTFVLKKAGDAFPFKERAVKHRNFLFHLPVGSQTPSTFYFRFETRSMFVLPLTIWSPTAFSSKDYQEQMVLGLFYGIIFAMGLYNSFLFLSLRDRSYLYYVLSIIGFGFVHMCMDGIAYEFLWPALSGWNDRSPLVMISFAMVWELKFAKNFLTAKAYTPKLDKFLSLQMGWWGLLIVYCLFGDRLTGAKLVFILPLVVAPTILSTTILCWRKGYRPARYFLIGQLAPICGGILYILSSQAILPVNFVTQYSLKIGYASAIILFSFALADRINLLRQEKEQAQVEALKSEAAQRAREQAEDARRKIEATANELAKSNRQLETTKADAERAREVAEGANSAKSVFLANMSHEIRTPLNAVLGYAQILQRAEGLQPRHRSALDTIYESGEHLRALIDEVLNLSRIEAGQLELQETDFDLSSLIRGLSTMFALRCEQEGLAWKVEWEEGNEGQGGMGAWETRRQGEMETRRQIIFNLQFSIVNPSGFVATRTNSGRP